MCSFRLFIYNFKFESYLNHRTFNQQSTLNKFRIGSHKLEIETGKHKNQPEAQHICKLFKFVGEDEIHLLIGCSKLSPVREPYIEKIISDVPVLQNYD